MKTSRKRQAPKEQARKSPVRKAPGSTGGGLYYHVEVRPKSDFVEFRTQDVGKRGHIQRVAGKRESGSWATVKWLIGKDDAHVRSGQLVPDTKEAKQVIKELGSTPVLLSGDRFSAHPRRKVPEGAKPTAVQREARRRNIRKAQTARKKK